MTLRRKVGRLVDKWGMRTALNYVRLLFTPFGAIRNYVLFPIGFFFRTPVVPLLFMIVQLYNVGRILAEKADIFKFLPVNIANGLLATSPSSLTAHPGMSILILTLWTALFLTLGSVRFCRNDLGGEY